MKKVSLIFILFIGFGCISYAQTITIGTQVWMTKNLDVATFRNGDSIPQAKTNEEWKKAGENKQASHTRALLPYGSRASLNALCA